MTAVIVSFMFVAGGQLDRYDTLDLLDRFFYLRWLAGSGISFLLISLLWRLADHFSVDRMSGNRTVTDRMSGAGTFADGLFAKMGVRHRGKTGTEREGRNPSPLCAHFIYVGIMLLGWMPAFLSIVPGVFSYDAYAEWEQVKTGMITSHHPVIHVMLVGGLLELFYRFTGSYNVGIGVYTLLQMFLTANVLALTVSYMKRRGIRPAARLLTLLFYSLSPVIQLFSICTTKDVLFTACELLLMMSVLRILGEQDVFFRENKAQAGFVLAVLGTMILRNNGLYIALVMLAVLFWGCRKYWKRYSLLAAAALLLYGVYVGPVYTLLSVTPGGVEEMLSVPIQQMARVYHYDHASLDSGDLELLCQVLPRENLDDYKPTVADPVKCGFDREGFYENRGDFFKLWARWGMEHPLTYINSFLVSTVDFWYPGAVMDGYKDPYGRSSYFDYRVAEPGEEIVVLKGLHDFYEHLSWDRAAQKKPFAFLVLSPGWYFLVFFVGFMYLWYHKKWKLLAPLLIPLLTMATALLGPMALVRYVLIFFYGFPLLLALFLSPRAFLSDVRK